MFSLESFLWGQECVTCIFPVLILLQLGARHIEESAFAPVRYATVSIYIFWFDAPLPAPLKTHSKSLTGPIEVLSAIM